MDKTLQLTLKINADTSGLNQALAGVGAGVKRVKVPVEINTGDLNGTGEKIGVAFQAEAAKTRVGLRTDQAGEIGSIIAKSVVKGVEDSLKDAGRNIGRGNLLGALGNIAATPFKIAGNVASTVIGGALSSTRLAATSAIQGLVNGIGIEVTKGVGTGLREGVEQKLANTFGSTEVIGRTAANQLLQQLGKAAQGIEERVSGAESPFRGVAAVIKSEFQKLVETAFDPSEVLAVSRAAQRQARQQRGQVEAEAADQLLLERQKALTEYQDFRERATKLRAASQAAQSKFEEKNILKAAELQKVLAGADQEQTLQTPQQRIATLAPRLEQATQERETLVGQAAIASKAELPELRKKALALDSEIDSIVAEINTLSKQKELAKPENIGAKLKGLAKEISEGVKSLQAIDEDRQKILDKYKDSKGTAREGLKKLFDDYTEQANTEKARIATLQAEQQRLKTKSAEPAKSPYAALTDQIDERTAKIAKINAEQTALLEQFKANPRAADAPEIKQRALALEEDKKQIAAEAKDLTERRKTLPSFAERVKPLVAELDDVNAKRVSIAEEVKATPAAKTPEKTKEFDRLTEQAKSLEAQIQQIRAEKEAALQQLEAITKEQAKLNETAEAITRTERELAERYKTAASNERLLGTNEERRNEVGQQLVTTLEALQTNKAQQDSNVATRNQGIEVGSKAAVQAQKAFDKGNQQEFLDFSAEADLAAKIIQQLEQEFEELAQTRKTLEAKAQKLRATLKEIPQGLPEAVKQAYLDLAGKLPEGDQIPTIKERTTETLGVAKAGYFDRENVIAFRPDTLAAIQSGQKLAKDQLEDLYEEVAHSLQLEFGKRNKENFQRFNAEATPAQVEPVLQELTNYDEKSRPIELDAKLIRDQKVAAALVRQDLQELTESIAKDGTDLYKLADQRLVAAQRGLNALASESAESGIDFNPQPLQEFIRGVATLARNTTAEFAQLSIQDFDPERLQALVTDVKKTLHYLDVLDQDIAQAAASQKAPPTAEPAEQGGALAVAKEKVSDLGGIVQRVSGVLSPISNVAEGTVHALAVVGKAGLALADKFGFAAAALIPGGALAYGPAKAVVKNVVGPLAIAGAASQVPGVGEVLGVLQSAIGALIAPETVGLANGVSQAVTAELHSALPTLFSTLSRGLAESGLPGAGLSAQAVNSIGGLLINTLEPVVAGVTSTADATITAVGGAAQELLSQLAAALVAGKVVEEGAKLATSEDARAGALKGIETIGSGLGQVVSGVQDGIQDAADAIDRTKRAVQQNIEGIKGAAERVAQGDIRAVADAVDETQAAVGNLTRGVQDVTKASTGAVQNVVEGAGKVVGVFGDLRSVKLPDGLNLVDLAQSQLIKIQQQLRKKLQKTLEAEAAGLPVIGGSATVKQDLALVGQVLEAKYEVVIDHVGDQVQQQIKAAPLDLPVKIAPLPELEPIVVQPAPQAQAQAIGQTVSTTARRADQGEEPSPIELAQQQLKNPAPEKATFKELVAEVDAAIAETDGEIKRVYAYFADVVAATKKAIKSGDVEAIAASTSEAKRLATQLAGQIAELQQDIAQSIPVLEQNGIDVDPSSPIGERLRKTKSALGQKAALIPQKLAGIGVKPEEAATEITREIDSGVAQQINPALAGITEGLNQKAAQLKTALSNLVEAAKTNPKIVSTAKDFAVIGTGMAASAAVSDHGQVASLAAELIAAITARGALSVGNVAAEGDLIGALQRLTAKLNDPATQKQLGNGLFGDILGFATSHVTDAVTGIPGSGAVAANTIVPKLQQLRGQSAPVDGLDLEPVANKNTQIESVLDELQQIAAASEKVDATVGDRIALFFLGLKQAYAKAPTPEVSQEIKNALDVLEGGLAGAGAGIGKETEQAIAESEQQLGKVEKQFAKIERQIAEAERLTDRVEEVVGGQELGRRQTGAEFDQRIASQPIQGDSSKTEKDRLEQEKRRLEYLQAIEKEIAQVEQQIAKLQPATLPTVGQAANSKALVPISPLVPQSAPIQPVQEQVSKALVEIKQTEKALVQYDASVAAAQAQATQATESLDELLKRLEALKQKQQYASNETKSYEVEDLSQYAVPRQTFNPTGEERGFVAQKRIERDASERQINDTLRTGKAPTGPPDEIQGMADSAIASFDKNAAKFDAAAAQIENGSTRTQKALRTVGESVSTFKQKLNEAGGVSGVLGKIGQSLGTVAEKAGLPVGAIGKLGNIIKGVGIAALAYVGVTQLGDAVVELGRRAFEASSKFELLQTRLKFVGGESALPENLKFIREESERLKRPVDQLAEGFTALTIATKDTALEGRTKALASSLGTLSRVYGLTAEQSQSVQYQLGQTIRLGRVQGDELRSISDAGINIVGALQKATGKSGVEFSKQLEAGEISAEMAVKALESLAKEAEGGLPGALQTSAASVDDLNRQFVDLSIAVGQKATPLFVAGVGAIGGGIKLLEQAGQKLAPVFDAIGNGVGLILDIASPIVGVIGAIAGVIGGDLLDGLVAPFQAINAGLTTIREQGQKAGEFFNTLGKIFNSTKQSVVEFLEKIPGFALIAEYANPVKLAVRALGAAIGVFLTAQLVALGSSAVQAIGKLLAMAATFAGPVVAAISAATAAAWRFVLTPMGLVLTGIAVAAAIAAPNMDKLAIAMSGLSDAQVKANDRATQFNNYYQKRLGQLQKGISLTAEELKKLKDGFQQNVKEGKDTATTAAKLTANLDRMQASAEAAAQIQAKLTKAMADATKAIKLQSQAIDAGYSTRLAGLNEALANQQITRERFDQEELASQGEKSGKYLELYKTQGDNLRNALAEANARLAAPLPDATRTEVKKQVEQLQDQIYEIEQKGGEQRISLAQNRVKVTENIDKDRAKRAENEIKTLENQLAAGSEYQLEIEEKISQNKQAETERRIKEIDRQIKTETVAGGKLSEIAKNLYSERAVLESELSRIVSEEATKRYDILLKAVEKDRDKLSTTISEAEIEANIELQNAQNAGLLKQAEVEVKKTNLTRDRLQKELALERASIDALQALPSPTDPEKAEEHQKRIREGKLKTGQIVQQIAENEYKRQEGIRNLAAKALDEQVKGAENAATAIEQIGKLASNALERQNKILEAQKSLRASIVGLHDEEFKILIETTTNEKDKATLQEKAAKFRLDSLRQSQALEERILELQIKQEQVQNRVAIIKAQAAVAKAEAEQAKVNANPESSDADKQAAALGVRASQIELGATVEPARLQEGLADFKRQQSKVDNRKELLGARFDYAKSIVDPMDKRDAIERVSNDAARGLRQGVLPIGNKITSPPPDYRQVDSASQQLGLTPKGVNLGRFVPPTPVDLHSGINTSGAMQLGDSSAELKALRSLTQAGVVGNLIQLVQLQQGLSTQIATLAGRPRVEQTTTIQQAPRRSILAGSLI